MATLIKFNIHDKKKIREVLKENFPNREVKKVVFLPRNKDDEIHAIGWADVYWKGRTTKGMVEIGKVI